MHASQKSITRTIVTEVPIFYHLKFCNYGLMVGNIIEICVLARGLSTNWKGKSENSSGFTIIGVLLLVELVLVNM